MYPSACIQNRCEEMWSGYECHGGVTGNGVINPLVGDGLCHDEINNADCNYDGGDCCVNVNTDQCSECKCLGSGVITSPGFPQKYQNNLNLNWLIQVPDGKFVQTNFISFDVEDESSCE